MLIWKGNSAIPTKIEELLIEQVIKEYYEAYFVGFNGYNKTQIEALHKKLLIDTATERRISDTNEDVEKRIWDKIHEMEARRKALIVIKNSHSTVSSNTVPNAYPTSATKIRLQVLIYRLTIIHFLNFIVVVHTNAR